MSNTESDKASMLDEVIEYLKTLHLQVQHYCAATGEGARNRILGGVLKGEDGELSKDFRDYELSTSNNGETQLPPQVTATLLLNTGTNASARKYTYAPTFLSRSAVAAIICNVVHSRCKLGALARIWKGGCIIRAIFLDRIKQAYARNLQLPNLLVDAEVVHLIS
uniref:phosphogluconate dehydrogenase (NADP(+)-dependent, decarboxylating) n=1 Tax=Tanacetum cinerariifolium TaxID=118510 RepID=A0A6L2NLK9_TANCI|nr:phosphogluconate dehydrogenase [Tanacetum cinerariifolium]